MQVGEGEDDFDSLDWTQCGESLMSLVTAIDRHLHLSPTRSAIYNVNSMFSWFLGGNR